MKDYLDTIMGVVAIVALLFSVYQFRKNNKISKSTFLLELRDKFQESRRHKIHKALRDGEKIVDWTIIDDYLGLFEVCEIMIKNNSIEIDDFKKLYGYRLQNILNDKKVVYYKMVLEVTYWENLYNLMIICFDENKTEIKNLKELSLNISKKKRTITDLRLFINIMNKISFSFNQGK